MSNPIPVEARELLDEARRLLSSADQRQRIVDVDRWSAAALIAQANDLGASYSAIAAALGRNPSTIGSYAKIARRYATTPESERPSWTDAWIEQVPPSDAASMRQRATARHLRDADVDERARIASELVSDPDVARRVIEQPSANAAIGRAQHEQGRDLVAATSEHRPSAQPIDEWLDVLRHVSYSANGLRHALRALQRRQHAMPEHVRDDVLDDVESMRTLLDWIESFAKSGPIDTDETLARLLNEES